MKRQRTKPVANAVQPDGSLMNQLRVLSQTMSRAGLANAFGQQYGGARDLFTVLGYPTDITAPDVMSRYKRGDLAKRIVNAPVQTTWRGKVTITENDKEEGGTALEKAYNQMERDLKLTNKYTRLDKLVGLGRYAVMLIGFDDGLDLKEEVKAGAKRKVLYLMPYSQESAAIAEYEDDATNARYGLPKFYDLKMKDVRTTGSSGSSSSSSSVRVHWSRILHVAEGTLEDEVMGTPRLEAVWNRLMDVDKIVGGSAEMFWKGARPGYAAQADPEATLMPADVEALTSQFENFEHGLSRWLRTQGIEVKSLAPQVSDPMNHLDVQLTLISAATGIPKRILSGSERGELASQQDEKNWLTIIADRREEYAEPMIVRALVDRLIEYKALPAPKDEDYEVVFVDLFTASDKEKAEVAKIVAETIATYSNALGADSILPVEYFLKKILGFNQDEIDEINAMVDQIVEEDIDEPVEPVVEEPQQGEIVEEEPEA